MISEVFITCAVTGGGGAPKQKNVPVTPEQIAESAIEAARAGAAAVHLHVRDLQTRVGVLDLDLYRDTVRRIRESDVNPVINLTTGEGCYIVLGSSNSPLPLSKETDMLGALERLAHIEELRPEICTLDCGSMSARGTSEGAMINTIGTLRVMAARLQELGVKPELEVLDTGHLRMVHSANDRRKRAGWIGGQSVSLPWTPGNQRRAGTASDRDPRSARSTRNEFKGDAREAQAQSSCPRGQE